MKRALLTGTLLLSGLAHAAESQQRESSPAKQEGRPKGEPPAPPGKGQTDTSRTGHMKGMHGMMMGEGMSCADMMGTATVKVENTKDGAVVRFTAKDQASIEKVQHMAQMMKSCMMGGGDGQKR